MGSRYPRYRRHPLVWVGLALLVVAILGRWLLPRVLHVPNAAIQITGVVLQGVATACMLLGIFKGGHRYEQEHPRAN